MTTAQKVCMCQTFFFFIYKITEFFTVKGKATFISLVFAKLCGRSIYYCLKCSRKLGEPFKFRPVF